MLNLAVVGGGWAGMAAAVRAVQAGHRVTLIEMAPHWGGRARSLPGSEPALDNGQHILIGAYVRTLDLMRSVGIEPGAVLQRMPLTLRTPDGRGLRVPPGPPSFSLLMAVCRCRGWTWADRLSLMAHALRWRAAGFSCAPTLTVDVLCRQLAPRVRTMLIEPLCVAALNTPSREASASVFLRVLQDALFGSSGSADLLLPRVPLSALLPGPAAAWLQAQGATLVLARQVQSLAPAAGKWLVDGELFDAVILACSAAEAARLAQGIAPRWSAQASALRYEPIVTVYLNCPGARLACPIVALAESTDAPAQFIFDHGALGIAPGRFACVVSGAQRWVDAGLETTAAAAVKQVCAAFAPGTWPQTPTVLRTVAEKRATFRCMPGLDRPTATIAARLVAAGDYVQGPYPATLEAAVRAGEDAVKLLAQSIAR